MECSKQIWNYLKNRGWNEYAISGVLGNIYAESKCDPYLLQSSYRKKLNMTSEEYVKNVDNNLYMNFADDHAGFGIVQFTHHTLKRPLLELAKKRNESIGSIILQLDFLMIQLEEVFPKVKKQLDEATSIKEASDAFMLGFEKPSDQSEANRQKRANYGENYYNVYKGDDNMAVKIGSARSSFGNVAPGDQNGGKEVSTQDWYLHQKGWYVYRAKDEQLRKYIAEGMEKACANNDIGYDQSTRLTLFNNVKNNDYDPSKTTKKVNTDCSACVRVCIYYALKKCGYDLSKYAPSNFLTSTLDVALMRTGLFEKITDDKHCKQSSYLANGDILNTRTKGHVVVVLSNGSKCDAKSGSTVVEEEVIITNCNEIMHTNAKVNIRTTPSTDGEIIAVIPINANVEIIEKHSNYWFKVKYNDKIGYSSNRLGYFIEGNAPEKMQVYGGKLNVRKGAGTTYAVVRVLQDGTKVDAYEEKNGFIKIGENEWCSNKFLKKI